MGYDVFCNRFKKSTNKKLKYIVYGKSFYHMGILMGIYLFLVITLEQNAFFVKYLFAISFVFFLFLLYFFGMKRIGIALSEEEFVLTKFKRFGFRVKSVLEINFDAIRNIRYKKFLGIHFVSLSFINQSGFLEKVHFCYRNVIWGFNINEQRKNAIELSKIVREKERILDKGDF